MKEINHYIKLVLKFTLCFFVILFTQFLFWAFNSSMFYISSLKEGFNIVLGNFRYITTTCIIYLLPYIFLSIIPITNLQNNNTYKTIKNCLFYLGLFIMLLFNCIDIAYYPFTFKRTNSEIFSYLGVNNNLIELLPRFLLDYWYLAITFVASIFAIVFISRRIDKINNKHKVKNSLYYIIPLIIITLVCIGIRGGFQLRPIGNMNANQYTKNPRNNDLVTNTPFSIYRSLFKNSLAEINYFNETELNNIYSPIHFPKPPLFRDPQLSPPIIGKTNIVIIILESFNAEYTGIYNHDNHSYTPFLDSLAKQSWVFKGMANGKRSIEGVPAVLGSIPDLMEDAFITSSYNFNEFTSIAKLLSEEGYRTSFFHGGNNGSMGFDLFSQQAGIHEYYGLNEYPNKNDYDGTWGIYDEEYFQYFADKLNKFKTPFISSIFSLSSHHPYTIPDKYKGKFPKGDIPILETIGYADNALRLFFEKISEMAFFENTLFVICADHTAQALGAFNNGSIGMYEIPILFYKKDFTDLMHKDFKRTILQQIDIAASILDLVGYNKEYFSLGNSPFDSRYSQFHISYQKEKFQLIKDGYLLNFSDLETSSLYNIDTDSLCKQNLINTEKEISIEMTNFIKAYIQQYNNRMLRNNLN